MWLTLTSDGALAVDDAGEEFMHVAPDFCGGVAIISETEHFGVIVQIKVSQDLHHWGWSSSPSPSSASNPPKLDTTNQIAANDLGRCILCIVTEN
ncbi:hypothetical protein RHMOL_Rhmol05G0208400 [Rhododendron molle]|uniref:Uncharacterized protein n=1 Tax=Rhododendron molle TaxID=49168 RepID=A0ACC0NSF0_RHOML|nr:hypothetical protein RHMOL_Rhmol05G0208400 [Rhododendron molle]